MEIYATDGERYLLVHDGVTALDLDAEARVLDSARDLLFPWVPATRFMRHGYWTLQTHDQALLDSLLGEATVVTEAEMGNY